MYDDNYEPFAHYPTPKPVDRFKAAYEAGFEAGKHDAHLSAGTWVPDCERCARSIAPLPF